MDLIKNMMSAISLMAIGRSENWCPVGLLETDAYSSGVKESKSKPVT